MLTTTLLKIAAVSIAATLPLSTLTIAENDSLQEEVTHTPSTQLFTQDLRLPTFYTDSFAPIENIPSPVDDTTLEDRGSVSISRNAERPPVASITPPGAIDVHAVAERIEAQEAKAAKKAAKKAAAEKAEKLIAAEKAEAEKVAAEKAEKKAKSATDKKVAKEKAKQAEKEAVAAKQVQPKPATGKKKAAKSASPVKNTAPKPESSSKTSSNGAHASIVAEAKALIGTPYLSGGTSTKGFDCSGFTSYVYGKAGISLPRDSSGQKAAGKVIPRSQAIPGDLIWSPGHVAIYLGGNNQIDAPRPGKTIQVRPIWQSNPTFLRF